MVARWANTSGRLSNGKVALVTGASAGIGKASALALLAAGWRVVLTARRLENCEAAIREAGVGADRAIAVRSNVAEPASVAAVFARAKEAFGRLDLLFNNAGMGAPAMPMEDLPWRSGTRWSPRTSPARPVLPGGGAHHEGAGSRRAHRHQRLDLGACDAADVVPTPRPTRMTGITKTLSRDLRKHDIAVGQIDIGNAATEMTERMTKGVMQANGEMAIEPRMDVKHVANSIVYMAGLPLDANVQFLTVMATKMPFVGRG